MKKLLFATILFLSACTAQAKEKDLVYNLTLFQGVDQKSYILRDNQFQMTPNGIVVITGVDNFIWHGDYMLQVIEVDPI